jgi:hypothetical protein
MESRCRPSATEPFHLSLNVPHNPAFLERIKQSKEREIGSGSDLRAAEIVIQTRYGSSDPQSVSLQFYFQSRLEYFRNEI